MDKTVDFNRAELRRVLVRKYNRMLDARDAIHEQIARSAGLTRAIHTARLKHHGRKVEEVRRLINEFESAA